MEGESAHSRETLGALLRSGDCSDLQLKFDDHTFYVHRAIIGLHSATLKTEAASCFREGRSGVINLAAPSASIDSVQRMLEYIYLGDYAILASDSDQGDESEGDEVCSATAVRILVAHVHVWALGSFYQVQGLSETAYGKLSIALKQHAQIDRFIEVVKETYDHTGEGDDLRMLIMCAVADNYHYFAKHETFRTTICADPALMSDYMKAVAISRDTADGMCEQHTGDLEDIRKRLTALKELIDWMEKGCCGRGLTVRARDLHETAWSAQCDICGVSFDD